MTIQDFIREGRKAALEHFGSMGVEGMVIEETETVKANDDVLHGVNVSREDSMTGFIIYVDELFDRYLQGESLGELIDEFVYMIECGMLTPTPPLDLTEYFDYERVRSRLTLKLLDVSYNKSYLKDRPYIDVGNGFALIALINCEPDVTSEWAMVVTEDILDNLGVDRETLLTAAMENTQNLEPAELMSMPEYLFRTVHMGEETRNLLDCGEDAEIADGSGPFFLSNRSKFMGAAALFYPGVMGRIAEVFKGGYYVLPSSVHEVIIIPDSLGADPENLSRLLIEGNSTVTERKDLLSHKVLHYDAELSQLGIAC